MTDTVIEKREVPTWIVSRVNAIGGMNRYGKPNYRVIWGGNRLYRVGGKFKNVTYFDTDIIGQQRAVVTEVREFRTLYKYHTSRWHLEKWMSPESYGSPDEFYAQTWDEECGFHTQGDYPWEGDYEHIFYLGMCSHMKPGDTEWCILCKASLGEYIELEENFKIIEMQIRAFEMTKGVSKVDERIALFKREADKREARNKVVSARVQEAMRPVMATQPTSWQDGTRCSVPDARLETLRQLPHTKLSFGQSNSVMPNHKQKEIEEN